MAGPIASGNLLRYGQSKITQVERFEADLARKIGTAHALTTTNGTRALISALAAAKIGPGDEVLVPAYTWIATAIAPLAVGAVPVLVNIDESLTIDPQDLERQITPQTKAVIVVHMGNAVCDMDAVMAIARKHQLLVVEDAAQAVGVRYKGRRVGSIGNAGIFSFNAYKNMNSAEGGAVLTSDQQLFVRARMVHDCGDFARGEDTFNEPAFIGFNFKANELQGAMLNVQLRKLDPYLDQLRRRRAIIAGALKAAKGFRITPHRDPADACSFSLLFDREEDAKAFATNRGVSRPYDNSKHVFTNWDSILSKRAFHPRMNPYDWAARPIDYSQERYAPTLDILARTCKIELGARWPLPVVWAYAQWLAKRLPTASATQVAKEDIALAA